MCTNAWSILIQRFCPQSSCARCRRPAVVDQPSPAEHWNLATGPKWDKVQWLSGRRTSLLTHYILEHEAILLVIWNSSWYLWETQVIAIYDIFKKPSMIPSESHIVAMCIIGHSIMQYFVWQLQNNDDNKMNFVFTINWGGESKINYYAPWWITYHTVLGGHLYLKLDIILVKNIYVIRVVFQDQAVYVRTSFRGAKICATGKKSVLSVIVANFGKDILDKLRKTHAKMHI